MVIKIEEDIIPKGLNWGISLSDLAEDEINWTAREIDDDELLRNWEANLDNIKKSVIETLEFWIDLEGIIKSWKWKRIIANLDEIPSKYHKEIVLCFIKFNEEVLFATNIFRFEWLDKEVLFELIDAWVIGLAINYLDVFNKLDIESAIKLIDAWYLDHVEANLEIFFIKYWGGNLSDVAIEFIEEWYSNYVIKNPEIFKGLNWKDLILLILGLIEAGFWNIIISDIDKFWKLTWSELMELALQLIEAWYWNFVKENVKIFWKSNWGKLNSDIAVELIELCQGVFVKENIEIFWWKDWEKLSFELVEYFIGGWYLNFVKENIEKFLWKDWEELTIEFVEDFSERLYKTRLLKKQINQ